MKFEQVLPGLREGKVYCRPSWDQDKMQVIFKQNDNAVSRDLIPKMTSLPDTAKTVLTEMSVLFLHYTCQVLMVDINSGVAKNYIPDWEDIFADDWIECEFPTEE